jgi:hypothetical protein
MDSDTGGGKSKLDFSDIMSMLDEGEQTKPGPKAIKKAEAPKDNAFTQKLLADIERKNAENLISARITCPSSTPSAKGTSR